MTSKVKQTVPWIVIAGIIIAVAGYLLQRDTKLETTYRQEGADAAVNESTRSWLRNHVGESDGEFKLYDARLDTVDQVNARQDVMIEMIHEQGKVIQQDVKEILRRLPPSP